jgi:UDP-3-O-[3-hydroxymyristoyl] glucosamine N-acyltransferase
MNGLALSEIARLVEGTLTGEEDLLIGGAATLSVARPGEITLADGPRLLPQLVRSQASAVIVPPNFKPEGRPYVTVGDVHAAFARVVSHFRPPRKTRLPGISPSAYVHPSATIGPDVEIHPHVFVGADVVIGEGTVIHSGVQILDGCNLGRHCRLFPNAVLYENTVLGERVIVHASAVLGAYGFGYTTVQGHHKLCSQLGYVEVGDEVEIGAGSTIDRGTYGPTVIGAGTKIDNLVQIGHNVRVGSHNLICSQAGIAGSSTTGDYVVLAGQVGVADHLHVADGAVIGAKAGVMIDALPGKRYLGAPAVEERQFFRTVSLLQQLPALRKQIAELRQQLAELTAARAIDEHLDGGHLDDGHLDDGHRDAA